MYSSPARGAMTLHGLTFERYQQFKQPFHAHVEGAQLTVVRRAGAQVLVIGAHYPSLVSTNRLLVDGNQAIERAHARAGAFTASRRLPRVGLQNRTQLRIDPIGGRLFQRVESFADGVQVFTRVDAETGAVLDSWDALAHEQGEGTGVHGDRKDLLGPGRNWRGRRPDATAERRMGDAHHGRPGFDVRRAARQPLLQRHRPDDRQPKGVVG